MSCGIRYRCVDGRWWPRLGAPQQPRTPCQHGHIGDACMGCLRHGGRPPLSQHSSMRQLRIMLFSWRGA